jgi:hypothetical protein
MTGFAVSQPLREAFRLKDQRVSSIHSRSLIEGRRWISPAKFQEMSCGIVSPLSSSGCASYLAAMIEHRSQI